MYMMFNPYQHLTQAYALTPEQWQRIEAELTPAQKETIKTGGYVKLGAATVWKKGN